MFLTGLLLLYAGYRLLAKRQKEVTEPMIPSTLASAESQAKYFVFVAVTDPIQRQMLQNEFAQVRRTNPYVNFYDWLDMRLPSWGFGTRCSRQQLVDAVMRVVMEGDTRRTMTVGGSVMGLEFSVADPAARADKLLDIAMGAPPAPGMGLLSGLTGSSTPPPPPPPPAQGSWGVPPPPQGGAGGYYGQPVAAPYYGYPPAPAAPPATGYPGYAPPYGYYNHPTAAPGVVIGAGGNPSGTPIHFSDVLSASAATPASAIDTQLPSSDATPVVAAAEVHGTDPFSRPPSASVPAAVITDPIAAPITFASGDVVTSPAKTA